jgi:hypothetical protein
MTDSTHQTPNYSTHPTTNGRELHCITTPDRDEAYCMLVAKAIRKAAETVSAYRTAIEAAAEGKPPSPAEMARIRDALVTLDDVLITARAGGRTA